MSHLRCLPRTSAVSPRPHGYPRQRPRPLLSWPPSSLPSLCHGTPSLLLGPCVASTQKRNKSTSHPHSDPHPHNHTNTPRPKSGFAKPFQKAKTFAARELQALVDYYGLELDTRPDPDLEDDGALVWNVGDDHEPWPLQNAVDAQTVRHLQDLLQDDEAPHDAVFATYKQLPAPGVVYLHIKTIRALLHHLSIVERPTPAAMQRFLAILDDMKMAHIHIITSEWTSAIHLTGRAMGNVSAVDLHSAVSIWQDMEQRAGLRSTYVTLNVLFTIAVKAGEFAMAETFLKMMHTRKLKMHRHHRASLIYYHGVKQDGNAVRNTYQQMIAAGDIIDTAIMNAVIAALIRAGEPAPAEHVFERMKRLHATRRTSAPGHRFFKRTWRDRRLLGLHLTYEARALSKMGEHDKVRQLQDFAPIAPDTTTYAILIRYHASTAGNIDRVKELLQEMRHNSLPLNGTIFIVVFHGFNTFGGVRYSSWTLDKLERMFAQYINALKENLEGTWLSSLAVVATLRAFAKVADRERTMKVWDELRSMWDPDEEELEKVLSVLRRLVPGEWDEVGKNGVSDGRGFFDEWPLRK